MHSYALQPWSCMSTVYQRLHLRSIAFFIPASLKVSVALAKSLRDNALPITRPNPNPNPTVVRCVNWFVGFGSPS